MLQLPHRGHRAALDAELLARWQDEDDENALDELLRRELETLVERVRRRGRALLGPTLSARDVAQETCLRLLRRAERPRFATLAGLRSYLWKVAWRLLLDRGKRRVHESNLPRILRERASGLDPGFDAGFARGARDGLGVERDVEADEDSCILRRTLQELPDGYRRILDLVYFEDRSLSGAARELAISRTAANMRLVRARRALGLRLRGRF